MLISLLLISLITLGGMALTYLLADDEPLMWRLSAGSVIGSAVFGLTVFIGACLFGLGPATVSVCAAITLLPLVLLKRRDVNQRFGHDRAKAKGKLEGVNRKKLGAFAYYAFFVVLFWFFFEQAMFETTEGIFTGGSNNLGDLPFHLGAIFSFTEGGNFPPENPSWAGARFSYPFMADLVTAAFVRLGAGVREAMFVQNIVWAFSLLVILERLVAKLTGSKLAGRLAPFLLFFSGGLGFLWFFSDYWQGARGLYDILWNLPRDYTIGDHFRWGNSMVVLFITQRSLLLGMPLTLIVLGYLWKVFATENTEDTEKNSKPLLHYFTSSPILFGLLAGLLPLIHLHSLVVLFVVTAFLFFLRLDRWREWVAFGIGVAVVSIPELLWSMTGSATETTKFFEWHFGWDKRDENVVWFWVKNTGLVIPALAAGAWLLFSQRSDLPKDARGEVPQPKAKSLLAFYAPFAFLFFISNIAKLAPWEWDNIKILIYWYVASVPFIAFALVWALDKTRGWQVLAAGSFLVLILSGALDVWRTASGQIKAKVFDTDAIKIAEQVKQRTEPQALFLNAPTYNSAVVLSGRRSLMRYNGHLSSHGIDYLPREDDVKRIYQGGGVADILLKKYDVGYVLVSPEERKELKANEDFFRKYPLVAESGQYRVYKVK